MKFEQVKRKVEHPPAAHNFARLNEPGDVPKTASLIVSFALSIPAFNYSTGTSACRDRVALQLDLATALKAVRSRGAPAGREHNAHFVEAFYAFDERRRYSSCQVIDSYQGRYLVSRDVEVPTRPTFTIFENNKHVPIILCGWKGLGLSRDQIRLWMTLLESGLFSYADYRLSPAEVVLFPEVEIAPKFRARTPLVIRRGDYELFSERRMREIAAEYVEAQEMALPIVADRWMERERRQREKERAKKRPDERPQPGLFD
jgi:hypothetical protein